MFRISLFVVDIQVRNCIQTSVLVNYFENNEIHGNKYIEHKLFLLFLCISPLRNISTSVTIQRDERRSSCNFSSYAYTDQVFWPVPLWTFWKYGSFRQLNYLDGWSARHRTDTNTGHHKISRNLETFILRVGFELKFLVFERAKTFCVSDRADAMSDTSLFIQGNIGHFCPIIIKIICVYIIY